MKPWTLAIGLVSACAACCALPVLGTGAALSLGAASLAAAGSALWACVVDAQALAAVLLALAGAALGLVLWRRRRARRGYCVPGECR